MNKAFKSFKKIYIKTPKINNRFFCSVNSNLPKTSHIKYNPEEPMSKEIRKFVTSNIKYLPKELMSKDMCEMAIKLDKHKNLSDLASMYYEEEDHEAANKIYKKLKKVYETAITLVSSSTAMNNLGFMYLDGKGVKQNYKKAIELFERAIKSENCNAMNNLGYMHKHGIGVEQDYKKAIELYEMAIKFGSEDAMINLAHMYEFGEGVKQSNEKAEELYNKYYFGSN